MLDPPSNFDPLIAWYTAFYRHGFVVSGLAYEYVDETDDDPTLCAVIHRADTELDEPITVIAQRDPLATCPELGPDWFSASVSYCGRVFQWTELPVNDMVNVSC